jgi:transmembrane sensor
VNWEILLKHINNESDAAENREVEHWLDEQAENQYLLDYLQKRKEQLQQPIKQSDVHDQWVLLLDRIFETPKSLNKPKSPKGYWLMGIAASLLIITSLAWLYQTNKADIQTITLKTPGNIRGRVTLPDGSEVFMAPDSKLSYTTAFGTKKRELHFTGEAFFNVKHNTHSQFIVYMANHVAVNVLGTSFNVYSRKDHPTEVKVASGLVGVVTDTQTQFLKAGQQLAYETGKPLMVKAVIHNDAAALQNESLFFKDNSTAEIAEKLQRWYNIGFKISPTARKYPRFSGEMKDDGINNVLQGLSYATGLKYHYTDTHTILLY